MAALRTRTPDDAPPPSSAARRTGRAAALIIAALATAVLLLAAIVVIFPWDGWGGVAMVTMGLLPTLALVGIGATVLLAVLHRRGGRGSRVATRILAAVVVVATVAVAVPLVSLSRTAETRGVSLSLWEGLAGGLNHGGPGPGITYTRADGQDLHLEVRRPEHPAAAPRPAVVWVHGGSWARGTSGATPKWNRWFADRGYTVFDIRYRLRPQPNWETAPADVACAIGWVKRHAAEYGVDPDRIVLAGVSAGAQLALRVGYTAGTPDAARPSCPAPDTGVAAVLALYGPTDLTRAWQVSTRRWQRPLEDYLGGPPSAVPERYRVSSPSEHVRPGLPPTLLAHGERDTVVQYEQMTRLAGQLDRAGVPHEAVGLPFGMHAYDIGWGAFTTQITRGVLDRFLDTHLDRR